jgi:hypothetical protein
MEKTAINILQHHNSTEYAAENTVSQAGCHQSPELKLPSFNSMYIMEGKDFMHN